MGNILIDNNKEHNNLILNSNFLDSMLKYGHKFKSSTIWLCSIFNQLDICEDEVLRLLFICKIEYG